MREYDPSKVIVISYGGGGFGTFIYHVLTQHANQTYKVNNSNFEFDSIGTSHETRVYTPIWYMEPSHYEIKLPDTDKVCLILSDNGFDRDQYGSIRQVFGNCKIVRVCISELVRAVYWNTCAYKSIESTPEDMVQNHVNKHWQDADEDWAKRENFTLHYHNWNHGWRPINDSLIYNIEFEDLMLFPVQTLTKLINQLGFDVIEIDKLKTLCDRWKIANHRYFKVYFDWIEIEKALDSDSNISLDSVTTLNDQGYLNYCIEKKYNVTIPVYDYRHWFKTTADILTMIAQIKNDQHS